MNKKKTEMTMFNAISQKIDHLLHSKEQLATKDRKIEEMEGMVTTLREAQRNYMNSLVQHMGTYAPKNQEVQFNGSTHQHFELGDMENALDRIVGMAEKHDTIMGEIQAHMSEHLAEDNSWEDTVMAVVKRIQLADELQAEKDLIFEKLSAIDLPDDQ